MVQSTLTEAHNGKCLLVDMGAFHLVEFAKTLCLPFMGSAVHGGVHVLQVVPQTLAMRMLVFAALDNTFKVHLCFTSANAVCQVAVHVLLLVLWAACRCMLLPSASSRHWLQHDAACSFR